MRPFFLAAAFTVTACATGTGAPPPSAPGGATPAFPAISVETLKNVTQTLSSDAFEGRAPTTPGEDKTISFIASQFAAAGLKPGNGGSWYQNVPLVEISPASDPALKITGGKMPITFAYRKDMVAGTRHAVPRVEVKDSGLVFAGYGINAPERGWNDYAGLDVKGKTVIVLVNDPDWEQPLGQGDFEGRAMTYYGRWTYKYEEAARQGAAAVFIVHDTEPAAYGWNVVESSNTGPLIDMQSDDDDGRSNVPVQGWLTNEAARKLLAAAGQDLDALAIAAKRKGFHPVPLNLKASITLQSSIRKQMSKNVIGVLPGTQRPDETILYTAHWDHLGRCTPDKAGDDICNGALDNASGVAGLVALARAASADGAAARSIVFLAVTAEESGLLGSQYYAEHPVYPLGKTVAGINMDVLNVAGRTRNMVVVGKGKSELEPVLDRWAARQDRVVEAEPTPERGYFYRSDHFSLAKKGVPMLYAEAGDDLRAGGVAAGKARADDYTANRYHGPKDEYDPYWDWSGAVEDLQLYYAIGRELADGNQWPNWYATAEFKAARDRSRSLP